MANGPFFAASFLPSGQLLGTYASSMSAAENTTMNALEQGADIETALQAGYLTGAKEAAGESLFWGIPLPKSSRQGSWPA